MRLGQLSRRSVDGSKKVSDEAPNSGRQQNGQFAPGNPGGHGSAATGKARHWKKLLHDAVTDEDFNAVIAVLLAEAKAGNPKLIVELLDRLIGKSTQAVEVTGSEGGDLVVRFKREGAGG